MLIKLNIHAKTTTLINTYHYFIRFSCPGTSITQMVFRMFADEGMTVNEAWWMMVNACLVSFYACVIPTSPKHSWNVFVFYEYKYMLFMLLSLGVAHVHNVVHIIDIAV